MRILITGGSGYLGSHTARALAARGFEIVLYDNFSTGFPALGRGFDLVEGDIADRVKLSPILDRCDAVMHFAASAYVTESVQDPRRYFHNNVEAALQMMDAILASRVRLIIFSSSCAVYGIPESLPVREDCPARPIHPYGATKLFFEHALEAYRISHGLRYAALRYFNAAGAHENGEIGEMHRPETHLLPLALQAILGDGPCLQVFGNDFETEPAAGRGERWAATINWWPDGAVPDL
jgi:UDP-arabinose 4-epimerase